jgi:DNA modification methylase
LRSYTRDGVTIYNADVAELYSRWEMPTVIVSDGGYGISKFPGDPHDAKDLPAWYEPHIREWGKRTTPITTLWFWNREIGWAVLHPILEKHGWNYISCNIWNKGMSRAAGDTNTQKLRRFPQVTEVCVQYARKAVFNVDSKTMTMQQWLRFEWERTGFPVSATNEVCGVKNAATRKYFTKDHLFYFPPPEKFALLVDYANAHGKPEGRPYFSLDGIKPLTSDEWANMRTKFHCELGTTNVWETPLLHDLERFKKGNKSIHPNQKPIALVELTIRASSDEGDMIWEPFGGLCTAAVASHKLHRGCLSAEVDAELFDIAVERLRTYDK